VLVDGRAVEELLVEPLLMLLDEASLEWVPERYSKSETIRPSNRDWSAADVEPSAEPEVGGMLCWPGRVESWA
jgi:hypothetical protein